MSSRAHRAYASASRQRSPREQEAELFRSISSRLRNARDGAEMDRVRALADNARLWAATSTFLQDPANQLPAETRAGIVSIGHAVGRAMASGKPDFDFLISVNDTMASGLSGAG
ncbi:MAG: flagellar biosynthesis regulator FlaF [Janthinobacterium lividum]